MQASGNKIQRIVDFMGKTGRESSQGGHFFRLDQLFMLGVHNRFEPEIFYKENSKGYVHKQKQEGGNKSVVKSVL